MTSTNNRFTVSSPRDILGYIPHALGYLPHESLVLLTLGSNILGATLRLDLPERDQLEFALKAYEFLQQDTTADAVIAVIYTEAAWPEPSNPPYQEMMHCLDLVLEPQGLPIQAAWLVSASTWRDYYCADSGCCPWPGNTMDGITDSELNAEMVFRGSAYDGSLEAAVARTVGKSWGAPEELEAAVARWRRSVAGRWLQEPQFAAVLDVWDSMFEGNADQEWFETNPDTVGYLLASLECRNLRDAILVLAACGRQTAWEGASACGLRELSEVPAQRPDSAPGTALAATARSASTSSSPQDPAPQDLAPQDLYYRTLTGSIAVAPSWRQLDLAYEVFRRLAAVSVGESRCALLVMLGWVEWARGRGSRAGSFFDLCLSADPTYRFALLLGELLGRGRLPDWASEPSIAWSGNRSRTA